MVSTRYIADGCCSANALQHSLEERWKPQLGHSQGLSLTHLLLPLTLHGSKASVLVQLAGNVQKISGSTGQVLRCRDKALAGHVSGFNVVSNCRLFWVYKWDPHTLLELSLGNTSCFPLQNICFVWTECREQGSCSEHIYIHICIYIHLLLFYTLLLLPTPCYFTTFLIHVPSMAQPPPSKLVVSLSRFLLDYLCAPTSFLPSLYKSKKFLRLLNTAKKTALAAVIKGRRG